MEALNQALFFYVNAPAQLGAPDLALTTFLAEGLIWLIPAGLLAGWLRGSDATREAIIEATVAAGFALALAQLIGMVFSRSANRPQGLGQAAPP